jgi:hypothetical protein
MSTGRRILFAVWIAIAGLRLREFWQWKAYSEDRECSWRHAERWHCVEFWCLLADDTIFDNKAIFNYFWSTTIIFRITLSLPSPTRSAVHHGPVSDYSICSELQEWKNRWPQPEKDTDHENDVHVHWERCLWKLQPWPCLHVSPNYT